jgi:predicted neutral ceramidase superfamily lipid hydrolase
MLRLILLFVIGYYLLIARSFFTTWLAIFQQDTQLTSEEKFLAIVILILSTVLWPVVLPLAYLELISKNPKILPE